MSNKLRINVVIPIYKDKLDYFESLSLEQCFRLLSRYSISVIKPESLDISFIQQQYPNVLVESFDDTFFNNGLHGYNKLMLSSIFYERFLKYDYILIYQLDAWVFRDELEHWCEMNYDYIGAPWVIKPKYNLLPLRLFIWLKSKYYKINGKILEYERIGNKVGNGGFSLRKVQSFYQSTIKQQDKIAYYCEQSKVNKNFSFFNEDVFWALENPDFRYPSYKKALQFSFDIRPELCMKLNKGAIPFGCHGWSKPLDTDFWKKIIPTEN